MLGVEVSALLFRRERERRQPRLSSPSLQALEILFVCLTHRLFLDFDLGIMLMSEPRTVGL
jgi:hypothetical protein